ncbi:Rv3235 family protein [Micromonospora sp. NPDC049900]|uniref:Rv3235 family protein n=1 Tax=unclassified Micromonospora TaxID=2617518 RepID=UPI003788A5DF
MTDLRRPGPPRPPVRLRPAPAIDPPFLDEDAAGWPVAVHGQLALDLFAGAAPWPVRREPDRPPTRRPVGEPGPQTHPAPSGPGSERARRLPPGALATATPAATRVAHRFVATCLEVFNGFRPPVQLRRHLDPTRTAHLLPELARAAARGAPTRRRSTRPGLRLRRLRVCEPRPAAIEVAAVFAGAAGRTWAMALRLEHRRGTWLCTDLRVL